MISLARILLELKPKEDPVWVYLDSCHYHIMDKLKNVYANQVKHVQRESISDSPAGSGELKPCFLLVVRDEMAQKPSDEYQTANNLRRCVTRLIQQRGDATICE
jgi:hypothetical protein